MSRGNYAFVGMTVLVYRLHSLHVLEDFKRYQSVIRLSGHLGSARKTNKKYIFFCKCKPLLNYQANTPYFTFFLFFCFLVLVFIPYFTSPKKKKSKKHKSPPLCPLFFVLTIFSQKISASFSFPYPLLLSISVLPEYLHQFSSCFTPLLLFLWHMCVYTVAL